MPRLTSPGADPARGPPMSTTTAPFATLLSTSALFVLVACGSSTPPAATAATTTAGTRHEMSSDAVAAPNAPHVTGKEAKDLVKNGGKVIDVRTPKEFGEKHVDGAENVPVDAIADHDFGPKDQVLVVYCGSGKRSAKAAADLKAKGYTKVYDLGAMSSWDE